MIFCSRAGEKKFARRAGRARDARAGRVFASALCGASEPRAPLESMSRAASTASASTSARASAREANERAGAGRASRPRARRRARRCVVFRRGAYKNLPRGSKPPYLTSYDVASADLELKRALGEDEGSTSRVTVDLEVEPCGANGFFVDILVTGAVDARCACCGEVFAFALPGTRGEKSSGDALEADASAETSRAASCLAWLDPDASEQTVSGDYEIFPFPENQDELDLTTLVSDTVEAMALPEEFVCPECALDEPTTWRVG